MKQNRSCQIHILNLSSLHKDIHWGTHQGKIKMIEYTFSSHYSYVLILASTTVDLSRNVQKVLSPISYVEMKYQQAQEENNSRTEPLAPAKNSKVAYSTTNCQLLWSKSETEGLWNLIWRRKKRSFGGIPSEFVAVMTNESQIVPRCFRSDSFSTFSKAVKSPNTSARTSVRWACELLLNLTEMNF